MTIQTGIRNAFAVLALGFALTACGGGGGGASSPLPSTNGGTVTTKATLHGGFARTTGTASGQRATKGLAGALVPIADFLIPDANVGYVTVGHMDNIQAVAYYDPTAGPVPSPLPSGVVWNITGKAGATTSNLQGGQNLLGQPDSIGALLLTSNGTTGAGVLNATASNGDSVNLTYYTYAGNALDAESQYTAAASGNPNANTKPCLAFTPNASPVPGNSGDLCLQVNADKTTSFFAPLAMVVVNKPIDQVNATDAASIGSVTTIPAVSLGNFTQTIVFRTASGNIAKFMPTQINAVNDPAVSNGQPIYSYGYYRVGTSAGWDI